MNKEKIITLIENSFLHNLLKNENVTDISYNGESIFYVDNLYGRKKANIDITKESANDFIRQIANLAEKQFSYSTPYLDVSVERYRINAVHKSLARINYDENITFSVRIASLTPKITDTSSFLNPALVSLFKVLINSKTSIIISGTTGSGKTELQRYLFSLMENNTRVVVIDNVQELENIRNERLDINFWQCDNKNPNASFVDLIRNALRSNPDWLIIAEARGKEMIDALNSAMTGLPLITTLHSQSVNDSPKRIISMVLMNEKKLTYLNVKRDLDSHIHFYIHVSKTLNQNNVIERYVDSVMEVDDFGNQNIIFQRFKNKENFHKISKNTVKNLIFSEKDHLFISTFIGDYYE